jgi:hypothetical protein
LLRFSCGADSCGDGGAFRFYCAVYPSISSRRRLATRMISFVQAL